VQLYRIDDDPLTRAVIGAAMKVHTALGPGLLESTYEMCLCYELAKTHLKVIRQASLPLQYESLQISKAYRVDLIVDDQIVVELKTSQSFAAAHFAQVLTYLRMSGLQRGLLINFNAVHLREGLKRVANNYTLGSSSAPSAPSASSSRFK
jgi:GxxExxY protein